MAAEEFVITVLGRSVSAEMQSRVEALLRGQGLGIDRQRWLAEEGSPTGYGCLETYASGRLREEQALRADFLALEQELRTDVVLQRESRFRMARRMFVFDMDSTLIQAEVIDELAKMAGVGDQVVAITASAMRGEIQFQESFRRRVGLLRGLPEERVYELLGRIPLMEGAERLFRILKLRGIKTAILSGGFTFFGAELERRLGVDHIHANVLDIADGRVTGEVKTQIVDGARKAALLVEIAERERIPLEQVVAMGDGANDLPMLRLAGLGVAFHAKPVVRASAAASLSHLGLDGVLFLIGLGDGEWVE